MNKIAITPGTMEAIGQALDLFGENRVLSGRWSDPVYVRNMTDEEVAHAKNFFGTLGCEVKEVR